MNEHLGRNKVCWCGSGKKFKHCHLGREQEEPLDRQEIFKSTKRAQKEYCLHPDAKSGNCSGDIVRAHSIQRNGGLSQIAENGHVHMLANDLGSLIKSNGKLTYSLVGVKNATTFTGLCGFHDNIVFEPIEKHPFAPTQETAFLLSYRAIARELYSKQFQDDNSEILKKGDRGLSVEMQKRFQEFLKVYKTGVEAGLADLRHHKAIYDNVLLSQDFSNVSYLMIEFDNVPDFMCSGAILPESDFEGNVLQSKLDFEQIDTRLEHCCFTLTATDVGGVAVLSWIGHSRSALRLAESLDRMSDPELPHAITRFTFEYFENVAISPKWWITLSPPFKDLLQKRTEAGMNPYQQRGPRCLLDDGVRAVNWHVIRRSKVYK